MKEKFPWWLWVAGVISVWPVLLCPVFLFGNPFGFDTDAAWYWRIVHVVATNLPWIVSVIAITRSFDLYSRGWPLWGAVLGYATAAASVALALYLLL